MLLARSLVCAHPGASAANSAVGPVDLAVAPGEWVAIVGGNGSGKSALLLTLAGLTPPRSGTIERVSTPGRPAVGIVFQEPETQFVTDRVARELAFPLENLGWARADIDARVASLLEAFDLFALAEASPARLSGGEMQRVALAAAIAPKPLCLLLDEPAAYLDGPSRAALAREVERLRKEDGVAVVWAACARDECPEAERVIELPSFPVETASAIAPAPLRESVAPVTATVLWRARDLALTRRDARGERTLWDGLFFEIRSGEFWVVLGANGSGKTSLLDALAGWLRPTRGKLEVDPSIEGSKSLGYLLQYPESQLFAATALEDVAFGVRARGGLAGPDLERRAHEAIARVGLGSEIAGRAPESLSLGQRRRLALAGVLASQPSILLLDEPTVGLDGPARRALLAAIDRCRQNGGTVVVASHDPGWKSLPGARSLIFESKSRGGGRLGSPGRQIPVTFETA